MVSTIGGSIGLIFLILAVLTGLHWIKVNRVAHMWIGITALAVGLLHGVAGILKFLGIF